MALPSSSDLELHYTGDVEQNGRLLDQSSANRHGEYGLAARWIWFVSPRALHANGTTYVAYTGGDGGDDGPLNNVVASVDHATGHTETFVVDEGIGNDDHIHPALLRRDDGHLVAFWAGHNSGTLYWRRTSNPDDITAWEPTQGISMASVTYNQPFQFPDGTIRAHYRNRAGTGDGHWYYRDSTDGAQSLGGQTRIFEAPAGHYSIYPVSAQDSTGDIHWFVTDAEGFQDEPKIDVRYCRYDRSADEYVDSSGSTIKTTANLPLLFSDLELVYDSSASGNHYSWVWDATVDANDNPACVFATFPSVTDHRYKWATHDDSSWSVNEVAQAGGYIEMRGEERYYSPGISLVDGDPTRLYASIKTADGQSELREYTTSDGGSTWSSTVVEDDNSTHQWRPVAPLNASSEAPVVWIAGGYYRLTQSPTVLKGLPETTGPAIAGDSEYAGVIGQNAFSSAPFSSGFSVSCLLDTGAAGSEQTHVDLGNVIELSTNQSGTGGLELHVNGTLVTSWSGAADNTVYFVEGKWDGSTAELWVNGTQEATASWSTAPDFDGRDTVSVLLRDWRYNQDVVDNPSTAALRVYSTATTDTESQDLYAAAEGDFQRATLKVWDGSQWVEQNAIQAYDGTQFLPEKGKVYNGNQWLPFEAPAITNFGVTVPDGADTSAPNISNFSVTEL